MKSETLTIRTEGVAFVVVTTQFEDGQFVRSDDHDTEHATIEAAREDMNSCADGADEFWIVTKRGQDFVSLAFDEAAVRQAVAELR